MKYCCSMLMIILAVCIQPAYSQERARDAAKDSLPRLEIPEITIIGKKAITLPFARKGEMFDVDIYQAPPADSSLLGRRPALPLSSLPLPEYSERRSPLHLSVDAALGSFSAGVFHGYADYQSRTWGVAGDCGYRTTQGHTANASAADRSIAVDGYSLVRTDNEFLKDLRLSVDTRYSHDTYGMFGVVSPSVERRRDHFTLSSELRSQDQEQNAMDVILGTQIWNVHDVRAGIDSGVSAVSPDLRASYGTTMRNVRITAGLAFASSSLDYAAVTQSPSVLNLFLSARWRARGDWLLTVGITYANGSGMDGEEKTLFSPIASAVLTLNRSSEVTFWWSPEEQLNTYGAHALETPYLARELRLGPEKKPINIGSSFRMSGDDYSVEVRAGFVQSSDKNVVVADDGKLSVELVDANEFSVGFDGLVRPTSSTRLDVTCALRSAHEKGSTIQLPMVPLARIHGRGELAFAFPLNVWSAVDYWSEQNADLRGQRQLGGTFLLGVGLSSTVVPRSVISFEIQNLLNTSYEWWSNYVAPGRQLSLRAQVNIR